MASNGTIAHRFANRDYNESRGLKGNSTHISGRNYFSYSTVFGQWVDVEKKVCLVYLGSTSNSSSKHQLRSYCFPKDVTVLPYDDGGSGYGYYRWHGCNLIGEYGTEFTERDRMTLVHYYASCMYDQLAAIIDGTTKGLECISFHWLDYIELLSNLYKDVSIKKYLAYIKKNGWKDSKRDTKAMVKMAKMLDDGERDVKTLVNAMFGEGTFERYWNYCARYRKAADKRAKIEALCARLGIASPYKSSWRGGRLDSGLTADQIRKLTAKERNELHFASIMRKESRKAESAVNEKYNKNFRNAYKWIVGFEPKQKSWGGGYESGVKNNCVNKDNGVLYECSGEHIFGFYWLDKSVSFDYDSFRMSEDKEQWIADFYAKCKEVALNRKAILTLQRIKAHTKEKAHSYDDDVFINDDYLRENTTEAEYAICAEFIRKQDKHFADEEARRRAAEIARIKAEEERKREEEFKAQIRQEQIDECINEGSEGCRNLWRKHLTSIGESKERYNEVAFNSDGDFFYHGNVLLRLNLNKDTVETSKSIRMTIATAKAMWKIVSKWHENPASFKQMNIKTLSGTYTIVSYKNDILTAGCHDIAYAEMEHMYNEIIANENAA